MIEENHVLINVNICKELNVQPEVFCCFLTVFDQCKKFYMNFFLTIVYNVTSGNAINLLATANASVSFLVSKQVLRCPRDNRTCHVSLV